LLLKVAELLHFPGLLFRFSVLPLGPVASSTLSFGSDGMSAPELQSYHWNVHALDTMLRDQ
jgi:hypothetical protein